MKLRVDDLANQLASELSPVYLVSGAEPLLVQEAGDAVRAAARGRGYSERERLAVESKFDWSLLEYAKQSRSLFAERRIIELQMESGSPGTAGSKALVNYVADLPEDIVLLVVCGKLESSAQRSRWVKSLEQAGAWVQIWPIELGRLPAWMGQRMRALGLVPDRDALRLLSERVEGNLLAAAQEIEKLAVLLPAGEVSAEDIVRAVGDSARFQLFDLADAALAGDVARVLRVFTGLRDEGIEPVLVSWSLVREIRTCAEICGSLESGQSIPQALAHHRVWERRKKLLSAALRRHSRADWWRLLQQGARVDRVAKGAQRGSAWDELLQLAMGMCGAGYLSATESGGIA